jgi:hypothetical protein
MEIGFALDISRARYLHNTKNASSHAHRYQSRTRYQHRKTLDSSTCPSLSCHALPCLAPALPLPCLCLLSAFSLLIPAFLSPLLANTWLAFEVAGKLDLYLVCSLFLHLPGLPLPFGR